MKTSLIGHECLRMYRRVPIHLYSSSSLQSSAIGSTSSSAAAGYRRLLKASKITFKNHEAAIKGAREELRSNFYKNKDVTDEMELKKLFLGINEVEEMLKFNIVQGERNERGNYGIFIFVVL